MEDTLNHLKFLNMLSPRGIHIPNCDKKGFYKKKQVSTVRELLSLPPSAYAEETPALHPSALAAAVACGSCHIQDLRGASPKSLNPGIFPLSASASRPTEQREASLEPLTSHRGTQTRSHCTVEGCFY